MRSRTPYEDELELFIHLRLQVKRSLQKMAFDIRAGSVDEQTLYHAIFSNRTRFGLEEATLLTYHFSWGDNDLSVSRFDATDGQVQASVNGIKAELIDIQKDNSRTIVGLT